MMHNKIILATNSAKHFHLETGKLLIKKFPDNEIRIILDENLNDKDVIVIGSTQPPANNLLELLLLVGAVLQKKAKNVTIFIPYFGYARSDKSDDQNEIVNVKTVSRLLKSVGGSNCTYAVLDPHSDSLKNYFPGSFKKVDITSQMVKSLPKFSDLTVLAPDKGSKSKALNFAKLLNCKNVVVVNKKRLEDSSVKLTNISENITSEVLIVDDMVSTGNTILETAKVLKTKGAKKIFVAVTHMVYTAEGWKKLDKSELVDRIYTTNSIQPPRHLSDKFNLIDISGFLGEYIYTR